MNLSKLKFADITLKECCHQVAILAVRGECFVDEVPEVLQEDFNTFSIGRTLSLIDGRSFTRDIIEYYKKITSIGIDYPIKFLKK